MGRRYRFRVGDIVRYGGGQTALMRIETRTGLTAKQARYYGEQCYGGSVGAFEDDCCEATAIDRKTWRDERKLYHLKP